MALAPFWGEPVYPEAAWDGLVVGITVALTLSVIAWRQERRSRRRDSGTPPDPSG